MLLGGAVAWPLDARTQQPTLVKRIGLMANLPLRPIENFRNRLSERGFIEGQNLMVEYRFAEGREERYADFAPSLTRVAVLGNSLNPLNRINLETAHRAAQKLSIGIEGFEVRSSEEVKSALRALVDARPDAALLASDTLLLSERRQIVETMATYRIPAIYPFREYAEVGGFIAYGQYLHPVWTRGRLTSIAS